MNINRLKTLVAAALLLAASLTLTHANLALRLSSDNGATWTTIMDGGLSDQDTNPGVISYQGSVPGWSVTLNLGTSKPMQGSAIAPNILLSGFDSSSGPGTLIIQLSDTDFTSASVGRTFTSSVGGTVGQAGGVAGARTYMDKGNALFGTPATSANAVLLTDQGPFADAFSDNKSALSAEAGGSPFSLTLEMTFTHFAANYSSFGHQLTAPPLMALNCASGTGKVGVPYSSSLVVTGGVPPYMFSISSGSLPPGLMLDSGTGAITGTPTTAGTFPFTAMVIDSIDSTTGDHVAFVNCNIVIDPSDVQLACAGGSGQVGAAYSSALVASGGTAPYTFSITAGSLPPGLTLNPTTGAIAGTPTAAGTFNYSAKVVDSTGGTAQTKTVNCSIIIAPPPLRLACAGGSGQVGVAYSSALVANGGTAPYTFSITAGSLPPGLTLNPATGAITGTPTAAGTFNYTAKVVDSTGGTALTTTVNCSITITPSPLMVSCASGSGTVGVPYNSALIVSGGTSPYKFMITAGSLPPGLTLNTNTGAITGTPTTAGTFPYTIKVTDSTGGTAQNKSVNCSITILPRPLNVSCAAASGTVGVPYSSAIVVSGGTPPYKFMLTSGPLPPGLTLNTNTGAITGTPTATGSFPYTVKVTDSTGGTAQTQSVNCTITITPPPGTLGHGDTATIGFWHNKNGQALINSLNGGPNSMNLANWLATSFPYCYGANAGANNLTGKKNSEVAAYFLTLFNTPNPPKTDAQLLGAALAVYVTTSGLAGNAAASYGFNVSVQGTGAKTYNVGSYGTAIGLTNNQTYTVLQLLQQANLRKKLGLFNKDAFNVIFDGINQRGDII